MRNEPYPDTNKYSLPSQHPVNDGEDEEESNDAQS